MFEGPIQRLIDELGRLPGIGAKSAQRLAFHLLNAEEMDARRLAEAIVEMREKVRLCTRCFNVAADLECSICRDLRRDPTLLCVVERAQDIIVIEKTAEYRGRYHVLGGHISPIDGVYAEHLRLPELKERIRDEGVTEVILATNPTLEGDATAMYIARDLKRDGLKMTRLASGLPVGGDLDYADEITLGRALSGRQEIATG